MSPQPAGVETAEAEGTPAGLPPVPGAVPSTPPNPFLPAFFRVERVRRETPDTFTLTLRPPQDGASFRFVPGQFNMLWRFGVGEVPISISGDPARPQSLVHTLRAVGAVTRSLAALKPGETVGVRGPFGSGWPADAARGKDVVVVAGGIGLAPLRPLIYLLLARRQEYGRVVLLYGARTPADLLYRRELEQWRGRFDVDVLVTVDRADAGWRGHVGVVTALFARCFFDPDECVAMVCGPEVMMRFTVAQLQARGVGDDRIYLSMERNMKCAVGFCGHCQFGPTFVCRDGPVFRYDRIRAFFGKREM